MFYQQTIRELRAQLSTWDTLHDAKKFELSKKQSELTAVQDAYRSLLKTLDGLKGQVYELETRNKQLVDALHCAEEVNMDIEEESVDLVRKLDLLEQVLKQLQIPVKLPARKK